MTDVAGPVVPAAPAPRASATGRTRSLPKQAVPGAPLWAVFAVLVLVGLLAPPFDAARSSLCADLLTGEHYVVGNALTNAVSQAGQLLGFVLGGTLVVWLGVGGALLVDALTFGLSAVLLVLQVRRSRS